MTVSISSIKADAKKALKGNWLMAIISGLTLLFSYLIIQNTASLLAVVLGEIWATVIMFVLLLLLFCPLLLGTFRCLWRLFGGMDDTVISVFYYFSKMSLYLKVLKFALKLAVRVAIFALIFYLPVIALNVIASPELYRIIDVPIPIWSQNLSLFVKFLSSFSFALVILSISKFYLAPILIIANEEIDLDEAIYMSRVISKGSLMDFVFLIISLIGWMLLSLFFLPLIFTLPYFIMCYIVHSKYSIKDYNDKIKSLSDDSFPSFVAGV